MSDNNNRGRLVAALVAAIVGALLLFYSGRQGSEGGLAFAAVVVGVLLFAATLWALSRGYRPGSYTPSDDELPHREWRLVPVPSFRLLGGPAPAAHPALRRL